MCASARVNDMAVRHGCTRPRSHRRLAHFPAFNASVDTRNGTVTYHGGIHLNATVDSDRGLLAPVIHNADRLDIAEIAATTVDLATRARANTLRADDLTGGHSPSPIADRGAPYSTHPSSASHVRP
jgi:pyruvate dehydrogenase E2 component (dihydrolipoamide acetyltransferase)